MLDVRYDKISNRTFFWNEDGDLSDRFNPFLEVPITDRAEDKEMNEKGEKSVTYKPPELVVERGGWGNKLDFLFSCISLSVGLGNVWRFPYLCYKNGGGAFLVTYTIAMIFCGIPMFYQEVAIGQFLGSGGMTFIGQLCPILKGVGYATMTIVFLLDIYYCIIISWTLYYLICTFATVPYLPWGDCDNWWNTERCSVGTSDTILNQTTKNQSVLFHHNMNKTTTPVEEFFDRKVLGISSGIEEVGGMQWQLFTCLVIGWILIYSVIRKGLNQSGKIIWFTATFPYVVLIILLVRAVSLNGAYEGLLYYITPQWDQLLTTGPWMDGATQIFFAYSIGCGALPALGSFNKFHHNCYKDAVITCIINTLTSLLAGAVTFCILGHLALELDTDVGQVVKSGPGLVFLTYPEVVLKLPGSAFWAIVFFIMLVILGIDSEFCLVEAFITGVVDNWSDSLRPHRHKFTVFICVLMFLLGIPMVTHGGMYVFQLMDYYSASGMSLLWVCFFQTIAISWIFGTEKLCDCIEQMIGIRPNKFWTICWRFCAPVVMLVIFGAQCVALKPLTYGRNYVYPSWANDIGFVLSFSSMMWVPLYAIFYAFSSSGTIWENIVNGLRPQIKQRRISIHDKQSGLLISSSLGGLMTPSPSFVEENIE